MQDLCSTFLTLLCELLGIACSTLCRKTVGIAVQHADTLLPRGWAKKLGHNV